MEEVLLLTLFRLRVTFQKGNFHEVLENRLLPFSFGETFSVYE